VAHEAKWKLERHEWSDVLDAIRDVSEPFGLKFEAGPGDGEASLKVRLLIPVKTAAPLAAALTELLTAEDVAKQLQPPRERPDEGQGRPTSYECWFAVDWDATPQLTVVGADGDNRSAWPVIVAFASAFAARLKGRPHD
jgi:hypothetical protein